MPRHPPRRTLPAVIDYFAETAPRSDALVCGMRRFPYGELRSAVVQVAAGLARLGVGSGDSVAILMGNRAEWVITSVAAGALGATVVAVNTWWTQHEIEYALTHSAASLLVCDVRYMRHDYATIIETLRRDGRLSKLRAVVGVEVGGPLPDSWIAWDWLRQSGVGSDLPLKPDPEGIAYVLYTSGSTSAPKGVQLRHGDLVTNTWHIGQRLGLGRHDRLWLAVSLFWGFGCSNAMPAILSHGGCLVLQESFEAAEALALLERESCTAIYGTPNMIQALTEHPARHSHDLTRLRTGATLGTPEQIRRAACLAPDICNVYGLTEVYGNSHATAAAEPLDLRLVSSGRPIDGVSQRIVDPETGQELGPEHVGEIRLKGRVTPGYLSDPEQTTAAFDEQGYFRTGDLGWVDAAGYLYFQGRLKELVKTGGINVSPVEIEIVLMEHPAVAHALVIGLPDATRDEVLGALVVPRAGHTPTMQELRDHCRQRLAAYKVPTKFHFSTEDALPLTTTGKVQKSRIAEMFFDSSVRGHHETA